MTEYIKKEKLPTLWCPGCGLGLILQSTAKAFEELNPGKIAVVSGIGCTGRSAGYLNVDSLHTLHGRAVPAAEGMKISNPELNVVVLSGDGDLLGIGGNHLLHTSRRNTNITIICNSNETYGLTGGQLSPTTKKGLKTSTSPYGNPYPPVNVQGLLTSNERYFYARTSVYHVDHMKKVIKEAIQWNGFAFVEIIGICIESFGKRQGYKHGYEMLAELKKEYKIVGGTTKLGNNELGVVKQ